MKRTFLKKNILIIGVKNFKEKDKMIDYYIVQNGKERLYAFSRKYSNSTYNLCKGGIKVNDLVVIRSRDTSIMALVKRVNYMLGYLAEYYELPLEMVV